MMQNRQKYQLGQFFWLAETLLLAILAVTLKKWWLILLIAPVLFREYFYVQLPKNRKAAVGKVFWMPELILIFSLSVYCIYRGMNDPFLYFRF